jgi:predicted RNase H-like HicB family nuclease
MQKEAETDEMRPGVTDYYINIFYSREDGGYIADVPDLRVCSAFGATAEEALAEVEKAKAAWLVAARETGKRVPPPRYRPAIYRTAWLGAGRIRPAIRTPREVPGDE